MEQSWTCVVFDYINYINYITNMLGTLMHKCFVTKLSISDNDDHLPPQAHPHPHTCTHMHTSKGNTWLICLMETVGSESWVMR